MKNPVSIVFLILLFSCSQPQQDQLVIVPGSPESIQINDSTYYFETVETLTADLNHDGKTDSIILKKLKNWQDPGDYHRATIKLAGKGKVDFDETTGWVNLEYINSNVVAQNKLNSKLSVLIQANENTDLLFLFGYAYASSPGSLTLISFDENKPIVVFRENFHLSNVEDINNDGRFELIGKKSFAEPIAYIDSIRYIGDYAPFSVYRLDQTFVLDSALTIQYNNEHYAGFFGFDHSDSIMVVDGFSRYDIKPYLFEKRTIIPNQIVGLITSSTSIEELIYFYGKENIKDAVVFSYEGIDIKGTELIFEDEADNITVEWENDKKTTPKYIRIENENSNWRTTDGIGIGSTISEVERANGKPFIIYGYEIDSYLAGTVKSWESGKLQQLGLQFKITEELPGADYMQIIGDEGITSNNPILLKAGLKVERMIIGFSN